MLFRVLSVFVLSCVASLSIAAQRNVVKAKYAEPDCCSLIISHPIEAHSVPVIVWFHGGGLTSGGAYIPAELEDTNYIIVAPNYRFLPSVSIDSCICDAAAAVAWTFKSIERYGGDQKNIFVAGHSAGGYLTSMIGFEKSYLQKYDIDADSIAGLFPFSGQAVTHYEWRKMHDIPETQVTVDRYAPLYNIRKDAPPYIMICGDRELELLGRYEENAYLWRMLKIIGHPCVSIFEIEGHNHGDMLHPGFHIMKNEIKKLIDHK